MDDQSSSSDGKKKVITLFGKKINVVQSPSSPLLEPLSESLTITPSSNSSPLSSIPPPSSSSSSNDNQEVQVLKLRLHLMEQKVKQLSDSNEKLSEQLMSQMRRCEDLEIERAGLQTILQKERDRLQVCEQENDKLLYRLVLAEKALDTRHLQAPYSPPPPSSSSSSSHGWAPVDDMYGRRGSYDDHRNRRYNNNNNNNNNRYEDRVPPEEYDRERERERERDRDREIHIDISRDPLYNDYRPFNDLHLPSPPLLPPSPPTPSPRVSVFNRLGNSASDMPNLPSPPSPQEEYTEREDRDRAKLEAKLDLPLGALTKKTKGEMKAAKKRTICTFFAETGNCRHKNTCRYVHASPNKRGKLDV